MVDSRTPDTGEPKSEAETESASSEGDGAEFVAGGSQWHPMTAAVLVGGALAATAGAYLGTRALARRNGCGDGKRLNSVMQAAVTACDVANHQAEPADAEPVKEPTVTAEPAAPVEPRVRSRG